MNLYSFLIKKERIAGLAISDTSVRVAILDVPKKNTKVQVSVLAEQPLADKTISNGIVHNKQALASALNQLFKKSRILRTPYVIVSIPANPVYCHIFSLPRSISREQLTGTVRLITEMQLPMKAADIYTDWQLIETGNSYEVFVVAIARKVVSEYLDVLQNAGIKTIALEFHPLSISRALDAPEKKPIMISQNNREDTAMYIIKDGTVLFSRVVPNKFVNRKDLKGEQDKIANFLAAEENTTVIELPLEKAKLTSSIAESQVLKKLDGTWLTSIGAALRGLMPRSQDKIVSLLPIGTEDAYQHQKALTVASFLSSIGIAVVALLCVAFGGAWALLYSIQQQTTTELERISALPVSPETTAMENKVSAFNETVRIAGELLKTMPQWSTVIDELQARITSGIILNNASLSSANDTLSIAGIAGTRDELNAFKRSLEASPLLTNIQLPLTNLDKKKTYRFLFHSA